MPFYNHNVPYEEHIKKAKRLERYDSIYKADRSLCKVNHHSPSPQPTVMTRLRTEPSDLNMLQSGHGGFPALPEQMKNEKRWKEKIARINAEVCFEGICGYLMPILKDMSICRIFCWERPVLTEQTVYGRLIRRDAIRAPHGAHWGI